MLPRPAVLFLKIVLCSKVFDFSPHFRNYIPGLSVQTTMTASTIPGLDRSIPETVLDQTPRHYTHEKGQHSLVESVALKALEKLLYDAKYVIPTQKRCAAPRSAIPSRNPIV